MSNETNFTLIPRVIIILDNRYIDGILYLQDKKEIIFD
jgi:hypothetical protein